MIYHQKSTRNYAEMIEENDEFIDIELMNLKQLTPDILLKFSDDQ